MRRLLPAKRRIFYRNADKQKAIQLLAFLVTLIAIQSLVIGNLAVQLKGAVQQCNTSNIE